MRATGKLAWWLAACVALAAGPAAAQSIWAALPSTEDFGAFVPPATDGPQRGLARVQCAVAHDGRLSDCRVLAEDPKGAGFGEHALTLAPKFRLTPEAARKMNGVIVIPIRFGAADEPPARRDLKFQGGAGYRRLGDAGPYYPDRAARLRLGAVVEADCRVVADGRLQGCRIVSLSPPNYGFEFAFLRMAERGWMTAAPAPEGVTGPPDGIWRFRMVFDPKGH